MTSIKFQGHMIINHSIVFLNNCTNISLYKNVDKYLQFYFTFLPGWFLNEVNQNTKLNANKSKKADCGF